MAGYAPFFFVYITALVLIELFVGVAFAWRSATESSRRIALLATAYAWALPLAILNFLGLPGMPTHPSTVALQASPASWIAWHVGWAIFLVAYAFASDGQARRSAALAPLTFVASGAAFFVLVRNSPSLPHFVGPGETIRTPFLAGIALAVLLDLVVIARLLRTRPVARDGWVLASVVFATVEAGLMLVSGERFSTPFFLARVCGLLGAAMMLGAVLADAVALVRQGAFDAAERERLAEFRVIADAMPQIVWRIDRHGRNLYTNERWAQYTGRPRVDGRDLDFRKAIHPDDVPIRNAAFAAATQTNGAYEATYRLRGADGTYRHFLARAEPILERGAVTGWVGTCTDVEQSTRDAERMRFLAATGRSLAQSLERDVVLETAVRAPVPAFADCALVNLLSDSGALVVAAAYHRDLARNERLRALVGASYVEPAGRGGTNDVMDDVRGVSIDVTDEVLRETVRPAYRETMAALGLRSAIVVPLYAAGEVRGTLNVMYAESGRRYDDDDVPFLEEIGRRVMLSIANAEHYGRERRVADRLQEASLPASLPAVPGLALDAVYRAGRSEAQIGGDWYDAFVCDDGRLFLSVGDVVGSGLEAAVTMGAVRQAMRGAVEVAPDPVDVLDAADRALLKREADRIVTAFVGLLDPATRLFTYATAGHPPPFLRNPDGTIVRLESVGLPLGLRRSFSQGYEGARSIVLPEGALLVLYTDGLTEAERDVTLGEERLAQALSGDFDGEAALAERIRRTVLDEHATSDARDDVAILTLRLTGIATNGAVPLAWKGVTFSDNR